MKNKNSNLYVLMGRRIKTIRKEKNIESSALANELNISLSELNAIEAGQVKISMDVLFSISNILETEMNFFITGIPNNQIIIASEMVDKYIDTFKFINSLSSKQKQVFSNMLSQLYLCSSKRCQKKII